jgi:hypothetical protein
MLSYFVGREKNEKTASRRFFLYGFEDTNRIFRHIVATLPRLV